MCVCSVKAPLLPGRSLSELTILLPPLLPLFYRRQRDYQVGDIVLARVKGYPCTCPLSCHALCHPYLLEDNSAFWPSSVIVLFRSTDIQPRLFLVCPVWPCKVYKKWTGKKEVWWGVWFFPEGD